MRASRKNAEYGWAGTVKPARGFPTGGAQARLASPIRRADLFACARERRATRSQRERNKFTRVSRLRLKNQGANLEILNSYPSVSGLDTPTRWILELEFAKLSIISETFGREATYSHA